MSIVIVNRLERRGESWPHIHQWVSLSEHPRGGDVSFCFMLEAEERSRVEMCLTCPARRMKQSGKVEKVEGRKSIE